MKLLFVDCCTKEGKLSKTRQLCDIFLNQVRKTSQDYEVETIVLKDEKLVPLLEFDIQKRDKLIQSGEMNDVMFNYAKQFSTADRIIIGAPYWDLSFPSLLKVYIEHIFVNGIVFSYQNGKQVGLCCAKKLMYIQTAGGFIEENEPGVAYLRAVCNTLGIPEVEHICAQGMNIQEIDTEKQWQKATADAINAAKVF